VANASVEFDLETLAPTFHLTVGLPGRSNAFAIATRLGLDPTIIDDARSMVATADLEAEQLLDEIHRQRDAARAERAEAEVLRQKAAEHERRLAARLDGLDAERAALLDAARAESQKELEAVRADLEETRRRVRHILDSARPAALAGMDRAAAAAALDEAEEQLEEIASRPLPVAAPVARPAAPSGAARRGLRLGDTVFLPSLNAEGQVISLSPTEAEVQVGRLRVKARVSELTRKGETTADRRPPTTNYQSPTTSPQASISSASHSSPGLELDLRGQTVEDALPALERYLDAAYLAGLPWVRIIHGKGTGKLRQAVRDELRRSPLVKSQETAEDREGGEGVTVARLAVGEAE
jgi:DNA mismatch repair protein MutS2